MTLFTVFFILFFCIIIVYDFSKTKGYIKAKILHVISLTFLFYNHLSCFQWLAWIIRYSEMQEKLTRQVGIISRELNFVQNVVYIVLGVVIMISVFGMLNRNDFYRRTLIKVLPFIIPSGAISFYTGYTQHGPNLNDYVVLTIGFIVFTLLYLGIFFLYRSKFMIDFFEQKLK